MGDRVLTCPTCGEPVDQESPLTVMPFCSRRCQQIDLGNWLDEKYGFPLEGEEDAEGRFEQEGAEDEI